MHQLIMQRLSSSRASVGSNTMSIRFDRDFHFKTPITEDILDLLSFGFLAVRVSGQNRAFSFDGRAQGDRVSIMRTNTSGSISSASSTPSGQGSRPSLISQTPEAKIDDKAVTLARFSERWRNHTHTFNVSGIADQPIFSSPQRVICCQSLRQS